MGGGGGGGGGGGRPNLEYVSSLVSGVLIHVLTVVFNTYHTVGHVAASLQRPSPSRRLFFLICNDHSQRRLCDFSLLSSPSLSLLSPSLLTTATAHLWGFSLSHSLNTFSLHTFFTLTPFCPSLSLCSLSLLPPSLPLPPPSRPLLLLLRSCGVGTRDDVSPPRCGVASGADGGSLRVECAGR